MSTVHEPSLAHVRVHDAMHTGILSTDSSTPIAVVARMMAEQRVHAIAVHESNHLRRPWSVVTAQDVVRAAVDAAPGETAGSAARDDLITIGSKDSLLEAAWLMSKHSLDHLIVVDPESGHPLGVVSTLDIAAVVGA